MRWTLKRVPSIYQDGIVVQNARTKRYRWVNGHLCSVNNAIIMMTGIIWATKHPLDLRREPEAREHE